MCLSVLHCYCLTASLPQVVAKIRQIGLLAPNSANDATKADQRALNGSYQIDWISQARWQRATAWQDKGVAAGACREPLEGI